MCTSFLYRGNDTLIAMNYDNHGRNLKLAPHRSDLFLVTLHSFGKDRPLFGIRSDGQMANQQVVDPCDGGKFSLGFHKLNTSAFIGKVLTQPEKFADIDAYLAKNTVVNPPKSSLHVFLASAKKTSYIIEPGRGIATYPATDRFTVMSNCPILDHQRTGVWKGFGVDRQLKAEECLQAATPDFGVQDAFAVLEKVHQVDPMWTTEFSFVYSYNQNTVYYCYDHQYDKIETYQMVR